MTKRPSKQEFEKLSLEFAKEMIDFSNYGENAIIEDELVERAAKMAIDWLEGVGLRSKIFEQQCANWVDLAEIDLSTLNLEPYKNYWFIGREYGSTNPLELFNGGFIKSVKGKCIDAGKHNKEYGLLADVRDNNGNDYIAQYVILEADGKVFNESFEPLPPKGVIVKNNKFSPIMTTQD